MWDRFFNEDFFRNLILIALASLVFSIVSSLIIFWITVDTSPEVFIQKSFDKEGIKIDVRNVGSTPAIDFNILLRGESVGGAPILEVGEHKTITIPLDMLGLAYLQTNDKISYTSNFSDLWAYESVQIGSDIEFGFSCYNCENKNIFDYPWQEHKTIKCENNSISLSCLFMD